MIHSRQFLAIINSAIACSEDGENIDGILTLSQDKENYFLNWFPQNLGQKGDIFNIINAKENFIETLWTFPLKININCNLIFDVQIKENPLTITFNRIGDKNKRMFIIKNEAFDDFTLFLEKLILNGIAVPMFEEGRSLFFNPKYKVGYFNIIGRNLTIDYEGPADLKIFWEYFNKFYDEFITAIHSYDFPLPPDYPLSVAARAECNLFLTKANQISAEMRNNHPAIHYSELSDLFDQKTGRIKNFDEIKERIYHNSVEPRVISVLFPFLVNVFPIDSTREEREEIKKKLKKEFDNLCESSSCLQDYQIRNNKKLDYPNKIIVHDVKRTDRRNPAFKKQDGFGLKLLDKILRVYIIYNQNVSYVQGMNDLFVPIIEAFIPTWSEEGDPYDYDGNIIKEGDIDYLLFWCYANFLEVTNHTTFLTYVSEKCKIMSENVMQTLEDFLPSVSFWIDVKKLNELIWCYSDYVLLFKRSFNTIWPVWTKIVTAKDPCDWVTNFATSLIICSFSKLSFIKNIAVTDILALFPSIIKELDLDKICNTAVYISSIYNKEFVKFQEEEIPDYQPEFFNLSF